MSILHILYYILAYILSKFGQTALEPCKAKDISRGQSIFSFCGIRNTCFYMAATSNTNRNFEKFQ